MTQVFPCRNSSGASGPGSFVCVGSVQSPYDAGVYFGGYLTDATGDPTMLSQVNLTTTFGRSNPGNFQVPGPVIAYMSGVLFDTPATIVYAPGASGSNIFIQYIYGGPSSALDGLPPSNTQVTCSLFEDSTFLSHGVGDVESDSISCYSYGSPPTSIEESPNVVYITMPPQFDVGHTYTMIVSQGTPAP